jgi:hypothetical protein
VIVRELFAKLGLQVDAGGFAAGEGLIGRLSSRLGGLGAVLGGAAVGLAGLVGGTAHAGAEAAALAQRVGLSTDAFQELQFAAGQAGVGTEEMTAGLKGLSHSLQAASMGAEEAWRALGQVGIHVGFGTKKFGAVDQVMGQVADRFATMPDGVRKTALAMQLFGGAGTRLIPLLNKGSAGIDELRRAAYEYGVVLDAETIQASKDFTEASRLAGASAKGLGYAIGGPLISSVTPWIRKGAEWVRLNRQIIAGRVHETVDTVATGLRKAKQAADPFLAVVKFLASSTTALHVALTALAVAVASQVGLAIAGLAASMEGLTLAELAAAAVPVLVGLAWAAAAALIALAIEDVYTYFDGGDSLLGRVIDSLGGLRKAYEDNYKFAEDHPYQTFILAAVDALGDLQKSVPEALDFWRKEFGAFWDWLTRKAREVAETIRIALGGSVDLAVTFATQGPLAAAGKLYKNYTGQSAGEAAAGALFGGGAAGPAAAAAASPTGATVFAPQVSAPVSVQVGPGADAQSIVDELGPHIERIWDDRMREAHEALQE